MKSHLGSLQQDRQLSLLLVMGRGQSIPSSVQGFASVKGLHVGQHSARTLQRGRKMTVLKYIIQSKICNTGELLSIKREFPADYQTIVEWARQEMQKNNIPIEEAQCPESSNKQNPSYR